MENNIVLSFKNITKRFPGVLALNNVSFDLSKGEIHCLVGENGAGKSTLIKILSGAYTSDGGELVVEGKVVTIDSPVAASRLGITVVYQELNAVLQLSVVDNIKLGRENAVWGFIDKKTNCEEILPYLKEINLDIDLNTQLSNLSVAQRQMVMIAKALSQNAKIIVFDEPTAMLSENEVETLFEIISILKKKGVAIIYISHRLKEIFRIGDRVTVLKDGTHVATINVSDTTEEDLAVKMVGRELTNTFPPKDKKIGDIYFEVKNLSTHILNNINFKLRKGEVLGIAGLVGSGRTEVLRAIFGADHIVNGQIILGGKAIKIYRPADAVKHKIGFVPEDRREQGIIKVLSVKENITIVFSRLRSILGFINKQKDNEVAQKYIKELDIKTPTMSQTIGNLSGGNQQKVVLSKWLSIDPKVLLLDEPTQGIDVGAKAEIYQIIDSLATQGMGVIIVSSDLIEILNISDTIMVMRDGRIVGKLSGDEMSEENVIEYAMGVKEHEGKV